MNNTNNDPFDNPDLLSEITSSDKEKVEQPKPEIPKDRPPIVITTKSGEVLTEVFPGESQSSQPQRPLLGRSMRPSMNEANFYRYEPYIALACKGSYRIFPRRERITRTGEGVTAHTFANNFRDAKKAYCRFSYPSTLIPSSFDPREIIATEDIDGESVNVVNKETAKILSAEEITSFLSNHSWPEPESL